MTPGSGIDSPARVLWSYASAVTLGPFKFNHFPSFPRNFVCYKRSANICSSEAASLLIVANSPV